MGYRQNKVNVTIDQGIALLLLNRPEKYNAMDEDAMDECIEALHNIAADDDIRVLVITGAGKAFCSGADRGSSIFRKNGPPEFWTFMQKINEIVLRIRGLPKPVVAAVNGLAVGGGCNIALACDMIVASQTAYFYQIYSRIGIHPDAGGTYFLPRLVGTAMACELMFTDRALDASEALRIGMINKVVPEEQLLDEVRSLAGQITCRSPMAIRMIKNSIYSSLKSDLETALEQEAKALSVLMFSEDYRESVAALIDKRDPVFKGR